MFRVTKAGYFYEYEIKTSLSDFRADRKKEVKSWDYLQRSFVVRNKHKELATGIVEGPNYFNYIVPAELVDVLQPELPEFAGLIVSGRGCTGSHATVVKPPKLHKEKVQLEVINHSQKRGMIRYWQLRNAYD